MRPLGAITSKSNEKIKLAASLSDKKNRDRTGLFLVEGIRLCKDVCISGLDVEAVYVTAGALEKYRTDLDEYFGPDRGYHLIDESVCGRLSDTGTPQGVFCVCKIPEKKLEIRSSGLYILTDFIQNPDNLGAIVRTAEALGFDGITVAGGCDLWSAKAIRASMGGVLRFPVEYCRSAPDAVKKMRSLGLCVCATVPDESAGDITAFGKKSGVCLVIGNEGNGISEETLSLCTDRLTIKMRGCAESLNASAAATIAMWELTR